MNKNVIKSITVRLCTFTSIIQIYAMTYFHCLCQQCSLLCINGL